jgi:hypothetical protein
MQLQMTTGSKIQQEHSDIVKHTCHHLGLSRLRLDSVNLHGVQRERDETADAHPKKEM